MTVAVIIARGGSTRIPRKNARDFCGEPLVVWSIRQAMCSKLVDAVIVSTDDDEIASVSAKEGAVILRRETGSEATEGQGGCAFVHAIQEIRAGRVVVKQIDEIVTILPTSPIRLPDDIDKMIYQKWTAAVDEVTVMTEKLETCIYKVTSPTTCHLEIWDKHNKYLHTGGGMSVINADRIIEVVGASPKMDSVYDSDPDKYVPKDYNVYVLKEWQTFELDIPEHWKVTEAVMEEYILKPLGRGCYENHKRVEVYPR